MNELKIKFEIKRARSAQVCAFAYIFMPACVCFY